MKADTFKSLQQILMMDHISEICSDIGNKTYEGTNL